MVTPIVPNNCTPSAGQPVDVYLSLGANLGQPRRQLAAALGALESESGITIGAVSDLYQSDAVGGPADQPKYLNAAVAIKTSLGPDALLQTTQAIERRLGRTRGEANAARTIDIDLLLYGDLVIDSPRLKIPHPRMHERRFVLQPLSDITPHRVHPVTNLSVEDLLRSLPDVPTVKRVLDPAWPPNVRTVPHQTATPGDRKTPAQHAGERKLGGFGVQTHDF